MILTYHFRIKDSSCKNKLTKMAHAVNFVWNYCNEVSKRSIEYNHKWLSGYDLNNLSSGCSKQLGISAVTIQSVCQVYALKRFKYQKTLSWRNQKKSLGWIPFKSKNIRLCGDYFKYHGHSFKLWKSREIEGKIKCGSFNQDSKGKWFVNITCEISQSIKISNLNSIGIDFGLKTLATLSNGNKIERENLTQKYESKLAMSQRAHKKKQEKTIRLKIKNSRKDFNHKETTKLINNYGSIFVGDVSPSKLQKTHLAKSVSDAGWYDFKSMLAYKAIRLGVEYKEVKENFSSITCSSCLSKTGPSGLSGLGVREWTCSHCGAIHDRDVNAAKNILRFGHESLIKGISHERMPNVATGSFQD